MEHRRKEDFLAWRLSAERLAFALLCGAVALWGALLVYLLVRG